MSVLTRARPFEVTSPAPRNEWIEVLESDQGALVTQTPEWLDSICATGPYEDASRLYYMPSGRRLVLPMVRVRRMPKTLGIESSFPLAWETGGLVAEGGLATEEIAAVLKDLASRSALRTSIHPNPLDGAKWAAACPPGIMAIPRLDHVLDLEGGADSVWKSRFGRSARGGVRKAERSGLEIECDTSGRLVGAFYDLLRQSFERWAHKQHEPAWLARWRGARRDPLRKFHAIAQRLGSSCQIWVARLEERPAAAIIVLRGTNAAYTRGAMDKELAARTRANDLLQWMAIQDACHAGCRHYHMGESGSERALADFKEKFGARPFRYAEYRIERLPVTRMDGLMRGAVKKTIGFKD